MANKDILLGKLRSGAPISFGERTKLVWMLSLPAIMAHFSTILMEYIDASMVGHLGSEKAAAIGLVASATWVLMGFCTSTSAGFTVQVAQLVGAKDYKRAREVMRKGFSSVLIFSVCLALLALSISRQLPVWIGGAPEVVHDAGIYLSIFCAFLPISQLCFTTCIMLQSSGNMKIPSITEICACIADVVLNYIFIYKCSMGVAGAALGTGLANLITHLFALWYLLRKSPELNIFQDEKGNWKPDMDTLKTAFGISGPMWLQNIVMRGGQFASTFIVAPLGTIAVATNGLATIAESVCYMPGFGFEEAATSLVGQSVGAKRKDMAQSFGYISTYTAASLMAVMAVIMFAFAPFIMGMLSSDPAVIELGTKVLRIEAFAEFMYGASIVAYGSCVGAGDTMVPMLINFVTMWLVRILLALILCPKIGLAGYWIAMCIELNVRGILMLVRLHGKRWLQKELI